MEAKLQHIFVNVSEPKISFPFYKEFLGILGFKIEVNDDHQIGLNNGTSEIWLRKGSNVNKFDRNAVGLNHIAFRVKTKENVDEFCEKFISKNNVKSLYSSPRIFDDFTPDYYAVYFEDPDGIKLEVTSYTFEFEQHDD